MSVVWALMMRRDPGNVAAQRDGGCEFVDGAEVHVALHGVKLVGSDDAEGHEREHERGSGCGYGCCVACESAARPGSAVAVERTVAERLASGLAPLRRSREHAADVSPLA